MYSELQWINCFLKKKVLLETNLTEVNSIKVKTVALMRNKQPKQ